MVLVGMVFLDEFSHLMGEMRDAIASGDALSLKGPAHSLKGAVGIFGVTAALEGAQKLESMGQADDLRGAEEGYARLEEELGRLKPALAAMVAGSPGPAPTP